MNESLWARATSQLWHLSAVCQTCRSATEFAHWRSRKGKPVEKWLLVVVNGAVRWILRVRIKMVRSTVWKDSIRSWTRRRRPCRELGVLRKSTTTSGCPRITCACTTKVGYLRISSAFLSRFSLRYYFRVDQSPTPLLFGFIKNKSNLFFNAWKIGALCHCLQLFLTVSRIQTKKSADHDTEVWESSRQESDCDRLPSAVALPSAAFLLFFGQQQSKIRLLPRSTLSLGFCLIDFCMFCPEQLL